MEEFDFTNYEINDDIANYDGFVTSLGFLKVRASDAPDSYPTHSDYAREYMKKEWGMDFDNSYDALRYLTDRMGFIQYSNRVYVIEGDPENVIDIYKDASRTGSYNFATSENLREVCQINADFYKRAKGNKK